MNTNDIFTAFNNLRVLVIGDVMIDAYCFGKVERISPEAPVPIVAVKKKENRLGGAANVAINIQALGATPVLCATIGKDDNSAILFELLQQQGLSKEGIIQSPTRTTTVKTRIIGNNHQMLRIDEEVDHNITKKEADELITRIKSLIEGQKIDVIIFEDYDKGTITQHLKNEVVAEDYTRNIPTTVDPKKRNFNHYQHVSLFKPNLERIKGRPSPRFRSQRPGNTGFGGK